MRSQWVLLILAALESSDLCAAPYRILYRVPGDERGIVALHPSGKVVAFVDQRRATINCVRFPDKQVLVRRASRHIPSALTFSPDGSRMVSLGERRAGGSKEVILWSGCDRPIARASLAAASMDDVWLVASSQAGERVVVAGAGAAVLERGKTIRRLPTPKDTSIGEVAISADGALLAIGFDGSTEKQPKVGRVQLYASDRLAVIREWSVGVHVWGLVFSPDNRLLYASGMPTSVLNTRSGARSAVDGLYGHLALSKDGKLLVAATAFNTLLMTSPGRQPPSSVEVPFVAERAYLSGDGTRLLVGANSSAYLLTLPRRRGLTPPSP